MLLGHNAVGVAIGLGTAPRQATVAAVILRREPWSDDGVARHAVVVLTTKEVERETGFEPATCSLEGCRSAN
jgi:hypothetical protein